MKHALSLLTAITVVACAPSHRANTIPAGDGPLVGVYRAAIDLGRGAALRHTRVSVWAEPPDRLHAELLSPVGGVRFVIDAGGGETCIVDVAAATAYVGRDEPGAIEKLVGVRVSAASAVAALLYGAAPTGLTVTREEATSGVLPDRIRIAEGTRSITLARIGFARGSADAESLGTGIAPPGLTVVPIESLQVADR